MAIKRPIVAIAYDFDGTLSPGNMQEYDFVPALKIKPGDFWESVKKEAEEQNADEILSYMHLMLEKANMEKVRIREQDIQAFGEKIDFFPGVEKWFDRINAYGKERKITVEHYIISSGLREMIEGTKIAKNFKKFMLLVLCMTRMVWPAGLRWLLTTLPRHNICFV